MVIIIYCSIGYKDNSSTLYYCNRHVESPNITKQKTTLFVVVHIYCYEGTPIGAWVNSKMSGRSPPLYYPITLIAMQGHQTNQHGSTKVTVGLDYSSLCYIASRIG